MDLFQKKRAAYDARWATETDVGKLLTEWSRGLKPLRFENRERVGLMPIYAPGQQESGAAAARRLQKVAPDVYQARLNEIRTGNRKSFNRSLVTIATIAGGGYAVGSAMAASSAASAAAAAPAATAAPASAGLTVQAGLPAYSGQIAAAKVASAGTVAGASGTAATVAKVGGIAKSALSIGGSVMSLNAMRKGPEQVQAENPFFASGAAVPTTRADAQVPVMATAANRNAVLVGAAALLAVVWFISKG